MSTRLATGGRLLNKSKPLSFTFNGKQMRGYEGDTLASALLANDQVLVGRSFKYHRPRGIVTSGPEEPNGLVGLGQEGQFEPNARVTTTELYEGLAAESQNHWPSLEFDVGALNKHLSRFLPAGFYYKMFMHPRPSSAIPQAWAKRQRRRMRIPMNTSTPSATCWSSAAGSRGCKRRWRRG